MDLPRIRLKPKTRATLLELLFITVSINILLYAYYFSTWWALGPYLRPGLFNNYLESGYIHLEIIVQGTLFGLLFGLINYISDNTKIRRKSFGAIILIKSLFYLFALILSAGIVLVMYIVFKIMPVEMMLGIIREDMSYSYMITFIVFSEG